MTSSQRLFSELEHGIRTGAIPSGGILPSENEFCTRYAISRPTVRRVLDKLASMNLVIRKPGIGTFAADPKAEDESWMTAPFRIGSEHLFRQDLHFTLPIISGMNRPPCGNSCYLKMLELAKIEEGTQDYDVDGLFLKDISANALEQVLKSGKPVILCNRPSPRHDVSSVRIDHVQEAQHGVELLLKFGFRKIAVAEGVNPVSMLRVDGWRRAYKDAGLTAPEDLILPSEAEDSQMIEFIRRSGFDAVFFTTGTVFRKFVPYYNILSGKNIAELRTLVFDDITVYPEFKNLSVSCIRMPLEEMGSFAVEYLRRKARFPETPVVDKLMKCQIVINQ